MLVIPLKRTGQVDLMGPMLMWVEKNDCVVDDAQSSHESVLADVARLEALRKKVADAPAILQSQSYGPDAYSLEDVYVDHIEYHACLMECEFRGLFEHAGLSFKWSGAFHEHDSGTSTSLTYERLAVLFNIGALESTLAARDVGLFKKSGIHQQRGLSTQQQQQQQQEPSRAY
jgi:hypothetical protein